MAKSIGASSMIIDVNKSINKLQFRTSISGVNSVIRSLKSMANKLQQTEENALNKIGKKYTKVAKRNLLNANHTQRDGDTLANEIYYSINGHNISIIAGQTPEVISQLYYAEFGAGMVSKQHPLANLNDWQYDVKGHGIKGWRYKTTQNDKTPLVSGEQAKAFYQEGKPYVIRTKDGELTGWTRYSQPTLFMYNTYKRITKDNYLSELLAQGIPELKSKYGKKFEEE